MTFSLTYAEPYTFPDYYSILGVTEKASQEDIALAYQRQAILYHPDNRNSTNTISEEERALRFQQLGDAFYVLNDSDRRRAYDKARQRGNHPERWRNAHTDPGQVFADAYDELMRPAVENPGYVWSTMGAGSGATLGFIVANIPGIVVVSNNYCS
jgi:curved DNA-binding protein CbpA